MLAQCTTTLNLLKGGLSCVPEDIKEAMLKHLQDLTVPWIETGINQIEGRPCGDSGFFKEQLLRVVQGHDVEMLLMAPAPESPSAETRNNVFALMQRGMQATIQRDEEFKRDPQKMAVQPNLREPSMR